ncbi:hypothetical protein IW148_000978 [Coemansia sp. RSA 1199]|nr:hypothetical protein IW148_000978 [Coemansia sp. RSA 1199]
MFTSPSVRVRRRPTAQQSRAEVSSSDSAAPKQTLKRSINASTMQNGSLQKAAALPANSAAFGQQRGHDDTDYSAAQSSSHKKQAVEPKRPVWLAPFAQRVQEPRVADVISEPEKPSTLQHKKVSEDEPIFGASIASIASAASGRTGLVAEDVKPARGTEADTLQTTDHILLRGDKHAVFDVAAFPEAVRRQLGSIDPESVPISAGLSSESSFAFVATPTTCLVWSYDSASSVMGGVYRLAMPDPDDATDFAAPLVALVSVGEVQSDVGVLACSATGQLRFWDRVAFGLGGTDRFHSRDLDLPDASDRCVQISEAFAGLFVVATIKGYLFQVSLQDVQGNVELTARCLSRSAGARTGMLSRMSSLLGGSQFVAAAADASDALVSIAGGGRTEIRHSRELYVLTRQRLAKWVVSRAHPERFLFSMDIVTALTQAAAQRLGMDVDVGVYDIATTRSGDVYVLTGLQGLQSGRREQLAVCILRSSRVSTEPDVLGMWPLRYAPDTELSQCGPNCPRLVLPEGGPGMFVVLRTAVIALMVPTAGASFEEAISFRAEDSILGISTAPRFPYVQHESSESSLVLTCAGTGVLQVCIEVGKIVSAVASAGVDTRADADDSEIRTNTAAWPSLGTRIGKAPRPSSPEREYQTQIEQAVFFRFGNDHNPLLFTIKSRATGVDPALETAALRVSQSILDNTSHFIVDRLDLGSHLNERLRRTRAVMQFIADSGLVSKISRETRVQLCAHAEKLAAAVALWTYQNDVWAAKRGAAAQLLDNLVASFLESAGLQTRDSLRMFFRQHVAAIGDVLVFMQRNLAPLCRALDDSESGRRDSQLVSYEANRVVVGALQAAFVFRFQNATLYDIDGSSESNGAFERWTEHPAISDLLVQRLEGSYRLCREISGQHCASVYERIIATTLPSDEDPSDASRSLDIFDDGVSISHPSLPDAAEPDSSEEARMRLISDDPYVSSLALLRETIDQVGPLANLCFRVFVDRITHLQATGSSEAHALVRRYDAARPRYLLCLVPLARASVAFRLAEEYHDLASLVTLVFTTERSNAAIYLRKYVERFGRDFADTLFAYYEKRQAWASLLNAQDSSFDAWLKEYVEKRAEYDPHGPVAQIGWIHDVKMNDFNAAATRLARAGRDSVEVDQARTMLSLSKLAFVAAECQDGNLGEAIDEVHARLEDALEMCEVQENLSQYLTAVVRSNRNHAAEISWRRRDDVSDKKAVLDAAMLTTTPEIRHERPALYVVYNELVRCIWNGRMLSVEDLVDALTFPDDMPATDSVLASCSADDAEQCNALIRERYSLAIDILSRASISLSEQTREAALKTIWRRVFLNDDWSAIRKRLGGNVPDSELRAELARTHLYAVLESCLATRELTHPDWYLLPADVFAAADLDYLVSARLAPRFASESDVGSGWQPLTSTTAPALNKDYGEEDTRLRAAIKCGLDSYYAEILRTVSDQVNRCRQSADGDASDMDAASSSASTEALDVEDEDVRMESD